MKQSGKEFLTSMNVFFVALLFGQVTAATVLYFLNGTPETGAETSIVDYLIPLISVAALALAFWLTPLRIESARSQKDLSDKLLFYRGAWIMRWALVEGVVLMNLVAYFFINPNIVFALFAGLGIAYFALLRAPGKDRVFEDLRLSSDEKDRFENEHDKVLVFK
jgi:hypothetical protein